VWCQGGARLLDHTGEGLPILMVPSLVNRAYILDLSAERSFLRHLARCGFRPLLLDWGLPRGAELHLTMADQILSRAQAALDAALDLTGERPILLGYCMGGLLAAALARARHRDLAGLALLATPWDFHAEAFSPVLFAERVLPLTASVAGLGFAPVELLQAFFAQLDPLRVVEKFQRFAEMPAHSARARLFVAVEDWLNDGVPLAGPVAQECLWHWYAENRPARGHWAPGGVAVRPEELDLPAFVAIPRRDRIVPAASAEPLAAGLPGATVIRPAAGHVSMVIGDAAPAELWRPFTDWLRRIAPRRSSRPVRPASVNL
jgi:polyhydroxyalkanoate synthase